MSQAPRYILDASVAVKWHLRDEQFTTESMAVLQDFQSGRIDLLAPEHIRYEVSSGIRNAIRTQRLSPQQAQTEVAAFLAWRVPTTNSDELILGGLAQSLRFGCSFYDGLYVALAEAAQCPLLYADGHMRNVIERRFAPALWIGNY